VVFIVIARQNMKGQPHEQCRSRARPWRSGAAESEKASR
jgi:hypothetical protein